jgi:hypothetical protein
VQQILPLLDRYCLACHDTDKQEGDLNLERFHSLTDVRRNPAVWQKVLDQLQDREMPPEKKKQPTSAEHSRLMDWIASYLDAEAHANAGDPGPVVLRRLSNAEYTYTIRDLTEVSTLDPVREFPADNAAGEGFTNDGAAMVMSPALLQKYLTAAKEVAAHVVLLPDGIRFSTHTTTRDETDALLEKIREVYRRYTTNGGGMSVDLQGIKFETNQGGVLPLHPYLERTVRDREALRSHPDLLQTLAQKHGLSAKYLALLWTALNRPPNAGSALERLQQKWQSTKPDEIRDLVKWIERERQGLWKYNKVGAIGKEATPTRWLEATDPESRLPSQDNIAAYIAAAFEEQPTGSLDPATLDKWRAFLGLKSTAPPALPTLFTSKFTEAHGHKSINGWGPSQTPNMLTNTATNEIRFLTLVVPPRSVCIHPSPGEDAVVAWRSPGEGLFKIQGLVADADSQCGNGAVWRVELRRPAETVILAHGQFDNGKGDSFNPDAAWSVAKDDVVALVVQARDRQHICDSTHVDLSLSEVEGEQRHWHLAGDLVDHVLTANPLPDAMGNPGVWHLGHQPNVAPSAAIPADPAFLAWRERTRSAKSPQDFEQQARELESLFTTSDAFRTLFPPTLCYDKIVPVDEVVTLTLFYREDDHLQRLMLNQAEIAELDRLWDELFYISQEPLKYLVAFEQVYEFSTQDNPRGVEQLTPHRAPTEQRAVAFQKRLTETEPAHLQGVLAFASRAWRHPLNHKEQSELLNFYRALRAESIGHGEAIRLTLARILTAPAFLYRSEQPGPGRSPHPVSPHEFATRLSTFLWSSTPDETLLTAAARGELADRDQRQAQLKRMVADPRITRLAELFACQWLGVRDFDQHNEKNETLFPEFQSLRSSMYAETIYFFTDLIQQNRSILSILDADHSYLDAPLATFYGLEVIGDQPARVTGLRANGRGGILGMASILAKQSGASRSSPILRGNWVYETLLGEHLPNPPANVPTLPERVPEGLTARQLIEQHSGNPACAKCHKKIDHYGFSLEGFDAIGRARVGSDTRTQLPDGSNLEGLNGLRDYLLTQRREDVVQQFCRKLLGYALGRSIQLSDQPLIDEMIRDLAINDYRMSRALELIINSPQFLHIRGREYDDSLSVEKE